MNATTNKLALAALFGLFLIGGNAEAAQVTVIRPASIIGITTFVNAAVDKGEMQRIWNDQSYTKEVQPGVIDVQVGQKHISVDVAEGQNVCVDVGIGLGLFGPSVNPTVVECK